MNAFLLSSLVVVFAFSANSKSFGNEVSKPEICVQTFNAYGPAYGWGLGDRTERLLKHFGSKPPCTFILMQEVWRDSHLEDLNHGMLLLGWPHQMDRGTSEHWTGLVNFAQSKLSPITEEVYTKNTDGILDKVRGVLGVEKGFLASESEVLGEKIVLINTHLHPLSERVRLTQILQLSEFILNLDRNKKIILAGDFNATPDSLEIEALVNISGLKNGLLETDNSESCTYCSDNPYSWSYKNRIIDYVFVRGFNVERGFINLKGTEKPFSDHYGIRLDLTYQSQNIPKSENISRRKTLEKVIARLSVETNEEFKSWSKLAEKILKNLEQE